MASIKLTKNLFAEVDEEDFEKINKLKWCASKSRSKIYAVNSKGSRKYMHHFVYGKKCLIDHIDGNGLNNKKSNLREATKSQNAANYPRKGYSYNNINKNWRTKIVFQGKSIEIGSFKTESEAKEAYEKKKKELFGEFA